MQQQVPRIRDIKWNELKRGGRINYFFATPLGYYEIGDDGFMFNPWICKYDDVETAKAAAQKDFDQKLYFVLNGTGSLEDIPKWKESWK